jgi:hypothetical protein
LAGSVTVIFWVPLVIAIYLLFYLDVHIVIDPFKAAQAGLNGVEQAGGYAPGSRRVSGSSAGAP